MAIESANVTRAKCDACPGIIYSEGGKAPKGYQGQAREVDAKGQLVARAAWFACQPNHVGKAILNVLNEVKKSGVVYRGSAGEPAIATPIVETPRYGDQGHPDIDDFTNADPEAAQG